MGDQGDGGDIESGIGGESRHDICVIVAGYVGESDPVKFLCQETPEHQLPLAARDGIRSLHCTGVKGHILEKSTYNR